MPEQHQPTGQVRVQVFRAELTQLESMRSFVEQQASRLGADQNACYDLILAVDEIVTNTILHGYRGAGGTISISIGARQGSIEICLRDHAPHFDPTTVAVPDIHLPLEQRRPGGMGIHLARNIVDRMLYRALPDGNELTLIKRV